jgi:hypothetical protein
LVGGEGFGVWDLVVTFPMIGDCYRIRYREIEDDWRGRNDLPDE